MRLPVVTQLIDAGGVGQRAGADLSRVEERLGRGRGHLDGCGEPLGARLGDASSRHAAVSVWDWICGIPLAERCWWNLSCSSEACGFTLLLPARDRIGRFGFWAYVAVLLFLHIGDRFSGPPENMKEIAITG